MGLMIAVGALLTWIAPTASAQDTSPKATVSIYPASALAEGQSGCTYYFTESGAPQPGGACGQAPFPPLRFSELTATGEPAIIRFDRAIALGPYASLDNRDYRRRAPPIVLTPVQRDELTWEIVLPKVNEPSFLSFGGNWSSERAQGHRDYVVGLLPAPQDSALEIRRAKWTGDRLTASGKVHPFAGSVVLRFSCNGSSIIKTVPANAGQWRVALRTPSACATTTDGRLAVRVSSTERLRAGKVGRRIAHRIARR